MMGIHANTADVYFSEELSTIKNEDIKTFVFQIFDAFGHDDFWVRPASRSGKYHQSYTCGEGGLARHSKVVAYYADRLAASWGSGRTDDHPMGRDAGPFHDEAVAAAIVHDLKKEGDTTRAHETGRQGEDRGRMITSCHGTDLCEAIWKRMLKGVGTESQKLILFGIAAHMGPWTFPESYRPYNIKHPVGQQVAWCVHMADMAAAQKVETLIDKVRQEPGFVAWEAKQKK